MPNIVSDIIVTPVTIFNAPTATAAPADTLAANAAWPVGWQNVGFTLEPLTLTYSFEVFEVNVQQTMSVVRRTRQTEEVMFETVLAEHTAANMALAFGGVATTTAPGTGQPGKETFSVGGDPNIPVRQWGMEGTYVDEDDALFPVRAFIWRATSAEGGEIEYDRENVAGIPLQIRGMADTTKAIGRQLMEVVRIVEPATV